MNILRSCELENVDKGIPRFIKSYINLYRTKQFIVKQIIKIVTDESGFSTKIISSDTYYARNASTDKEYLRLINGSFDNINGARIPVSMSERKYIY